MTNIELKRALIEILCNNKECWFKVGQLLLKCFEEDKDIKKNKSLYRNRIYKRLKEFSSIGIIELRRLTDNSFEYRWKRI